MNIESVEQIEYLAVEIDGDHWRRFPFAVWYQVFPDGSVDGASKQEIVELEKALKIFLNEDM